jgi:hypothetical protein
MPAMKHSSLALATLLALTLSACGDDDAATPPIPDAGTPDLGRPLPECTLQTPIVAGTTETDALANAPARCGAPAYTWLRDANLGEVVDRRRVSVYRIDQLTALAVSTEVSLPRPPEHDVYIERVAYKTQDRGVSVESSMGLAFPMDDATATERPILLFLHGTSGFRAGCGPSSDGSYQILASLLASYGWIVAMPDFLGLESLGAPYGAPHPYLVGEPTAIASLDAARAAMRAVATRPGNLCASTKLLVLGISQGGHAALWVDRLAPYYAREFELAGVVADVPPANLRAETLLALTSIIDGTSNVIATMAALPPWYGFGGRIGDFLKSPYDVDVPAAMAADCDPSGAVATPAALSDVFTDAVLTAASSGDLAGIAPWDCVVDENSLTSTPIARLEPASASYGILYVLGENDPLVNTPIERTSYDTLCAAGMPLQYLECAGAGHADAAYWSLPEALDFLSARETGVAFTPECTRPAAATCRGMP